MLITLMLEKIVGSRLRWRGQCFGGLAGSLIVITIILGGECPTKDL